MINTIYIMYILLMDPVNQTNTTSQSTTPPQWAPVTDANVVIAGAFGGTLPTPPVISDTMPAFSFDQDDFWGTNNNPIPPTPHYENITDPFAGGITSTTSTSIPSDVTMVENTAPTEETTTTIEEKLPEGTVSLDSLEETTPEETTTLDNTTVTPESPIVASSEETLSTPIQEISLPVEEVIEEVKVEPTTETIQPLTNTDDSLPTTSENQDISFDLPVDSSQHTDTTVSFDLPTVEKPVIQDITFDLPNQPDATRAQEVEPEETTTLDNTTVTPESPIVASSEETLSTPIQEISLPVEEVIEEVKVEPTTETIQPLTNTDDSLPTVSVSETRNEDGHDLQEVYDEFKQSFKQYSTFKWSLSLSLVWLRTDEDEITYTFTESQENNLTITKSNTTDILSFEETESGLKVLLNSDSLWYYGIDQVDSDTTHFLKEKLGKFTMMLQSEYEREEKRQREWLKKIKESLRSF